MELSRLCVGSVLTPHSVRIELNGLVGELGIVGMHIWCHEKPHTTWGGEHNTIQYTDDALQNCTLETYVILLTSVTSIDSIKEKKRESHILHKAFWKRLQAFVICQDFL